MSELNKEVEKAIKEKFGKLKGFEPEDVKYTDSTYWNFVEQSNTHEPIEAAPDAVSSTDTPWMNDDYEQKHEQLDALREAITGLKLNETDSLILKFFLAGMVQKDIADSVGVNQSTVAKRIKIIAEKLKNKMTSVE